MTLSPGDELRLTLLSVEADAAVEDLPQAVRTNVPSSDERARRNEQAIPVPRGTTLDALHDAADAAYPDHSLAIRDDELLENGPDGGGPGQGPWGGHHGPHGGPSGPGNGRGRGQDPGPGRPRTRNAGVVLGGTRGGTLAPPAYLWHHSTVPTELGFVVNTTGTFGFVCTVYWGYGHPYMVERGRVEVNE
ncbi:hypothetical protein [Halorarum salinum]|uniref:Uncharacterized protein n=1 Tax=Halorarum salinum TaxID=2743089 RepID=A0A7D5LB88_9EURY|nr:hypothetical protein [Halobaculum salinum]QLG61869.1 hypothetical protein HUG12_09070 [Halobaculum salinum]